MARLPAGMYKRKNGLICYRFTVEGKRCAVYGSSVKECREKELQKRKKIEEGTYTFGKTLKVSEYFERWLDSRSGSVTPATLRTYRKLANSIIRQPIDQAGHAFGDIKLEALETENCRQLQRALTADGLQTRTVNDSISLLKHALETACNERIISWNPAKAVERLKRTEQPARDNIHRALTREEVEIFLKAAAGSWYYPLYVFLLYTGMRIGEASAVAIRDVTESYINVCKTVTREDVVGYVIREQTKTKAGRRTIPTHREAWKAFQQQRHINEIINSGKVVKLDNPVFTLPKGGIIRPDRVNSDIKRICKKADIEYFTCHAFRATFISRLMAEGAPIHIILDVSGHENFKETLYYTDAEEKQKREYILAVNI